MFVKLRPWKAAKSTSVQPGAAVSNAALPMPMASPPLPCPPNIITRTAAATPVVNWHQGAQRNLQSLPACSTSGSSSRLQRFPAQPIQPMPAAETAALPPHD
eukprot:TRINITY_DN157_c1_g1_i1.p4 TRINITY_DN157_c1_g1~~TRINITY_DN157_c1_g1_i1.p4  ORF type:complete len:102 (+),score=13.31 TRINITY_DN157_c1_g1_i1:324-629(+)